MMLRLIAVLLSSVCMLSACTHTEDGPVNEYPNMGQTHNQHASTTAAKMISPVVP